MGRTDPVCPRAPLQKLVMEPRKPPPMIVLPHGGPHSFSTAIFEPEWAFYAGSQVML